MFGLSMTHPQVAENAPIFAVVLSWVAWNFLHLKGRNCRAVTVFSRNERFGAENLTWYTYLNEMMDLRSFSNLWFWIALAVMWSSASHWVLGVPYDMVARAARQQGEAEADLERVTYSFVARRLYVAEVAGTWLVVLSSFVLTSLLVLGWGYDIEIAQALSLLGSPMTLVWVISQRAAQRIAREEQRGATLRRTLTRLRIWIQVIGMVSIFVTSVWGIYTNLVRHLDNDYFKAEAVEPLQPAQK